MKNEDIESLNKMIESMDAIAERLDNIMQAVQRQNIAVVETRAVLRVKAEEIRNHVARRMGKTEMYKVAVSPYTVVPLELLIFGGIKLIEATGILLDKGIEEVEENNRDIERWLEIQKKEMEALKKLYSKSEE